MTQLTGQVESAREDRMGVSFGIDFSGSTNFVLLPSSAPTAAKPAATASEPAPTLATTSNVEESANKLSTAATAEITVEGVATVVTSTTTTPEAGNKRGGGSEGGHNGEGEVANAGNKDQKVPVAGAKTTKPRSTGNNLDNDDQEGGEARHVMSARISTGAFCRAVVARLTVRDPKLGGAIKVRGHRRRVHAVKYGRRYREGF